MKINIKDHFEKAKMEHLELVAKATREMKVVKEEIALKAEEKARLETDKKKTKNLLAENQEAGVDATKLEPKILDLDLKIDRIIRDLKVLQKNQQRLDEVLNHPLEQEDKLALFLQFYREEAVVVDSLEECFLGLHLPEITLDQLGCPIRCKIRIGESFENVLNINPSDKHIWKNFRPESLEWLPVVAESQGLYRDICRFNRNPNGEIVAMEIETEQDQPTSVFYNRKSGKFITAGYFNTSFSDFAISLEAELGALIKVEKGELDLSKSYKDNPLLARARSIVVSQTISKPFFNKSCEQLTSSEIYKRIKNDWGLFVNSPWTAEIKGTLALLKYHVENGEKVCFWSGGFKDEYGFRMRTNEHDWVIGKIFIDTSGKTVASKTAAKIYVSHRYPIQTASFGRLFLSCERDESERR